METQSNHIPESASHRYERVWADFSASVQRGENTTLSLYCRMTHTSYEGIKHWIHSRGLSVRALKKSNHTHGAQLVAGAAETKPVSFIQIAPSEPRVSSVAMRGISITFPDGVNLSLQECSAESVADLLSIYKSRCGVAGGM